MLLHLGSIIDRALASVQLEFAVQGRVPAEWKGVDGQSISMELWNVCN